MTGTTHRGDQRTLASMGKRRPPTETAAVIDNMLSRLRATGVTGLSQYERRLQANAANVANLEDLLFEGRAAIALRTSQCSVHLRESPDIEVVLDNDVAYAEVKHFREKEQDRIDEAAMQDATDLLVKIGDTTLLEGVEPWQQIVNVAVRKASQYVSGSPNVLVIESSSDSMELMAGTAVKVLDDMIAQGGDSRFRRLNAIMLVNTAYRAIGPAGLKNVEFEPTAHPAVTMSERLSATFRSIRLA